MIAEMENSEDNSLILIEEIENGLHPIAVRRVVEYLIDIAKRKNLQIIFTTHSDYALEPLPGEAIWSCVQGRLQQGKLSIETLQSQGAYTLAESHTLYKCLNKLKEEPKTQDNVWFKRWNGKLQQSKRPRSI